MRQSPGHVCTTQDQTDRSVIDQAQVKQVKRPHDIARAEILLDRQFRLASLTKIVTGWAAMIAVEEGTIELAEPVVGAMAAMKRTLEAEAMTAPDHVYSVYIKAARNLGAKGLRIYSAVIFPAALPSIVTGMKMGWAFAWRSLMAGELLYTLPGLGHLLNMGRELNDMAQVLAVILVIITIGLLADKLVFGTIEKRVRSRWGLR